MRLATHWYGPALLCLLLTAGSAQAQTAAPKRSSAAAAVSTPTAAAPAGIAPAAAPSPAPVSVHEQQLQAIRQALIEATIQAPTQVIASSWIDDMGALRESHQFNSKAEVRSVRLLPFDAPEPKQAAPRASADVLPWGWRHDPQTQNSCSPAPRAWRSPLVLSSQRAAGFPGPQQSASQALLQATVAHAQQALQQGVRWDVRTSSVTERINYLRSLSAPAREDSAPWQLDIRLEPQGPGTRTTTQDTTTVSDGKSEVRWIGDQPWIWLLRLSLTQNSGHAQGNSTSWQQEFRIAVDLEKLAEHPGQWRTPIEAALNTRVTAWLAGIERQLQCEPVQFVVRSQTGGVLQLMAGAGSGLRPGDRVLIMQPGWVPSRMLDPRAADHLALAEVVRLSSGHTDIRQLAGPPLPIGSDWVALPL